MKLMVGISAAHLGGACDPEPIVETRPTGQLEMALTGRGSSGAVYRLRQGNFEITGRAARSFSSETHLGQDRVTLTLPSGAYEIDLGSGWFLERAEGSGFTAVPGARLVSQNPTAFRIENRSTTRVTFRFRVGDDDVTLGEGTLIVDISVDDGSSGEGGHAGEAGAGGNSGEGGSAGTASEPSGGVAGIGGATGGAVPAGAGGVAGSPSSGGAGGIAGAAALAGMGGSGGASSSFPRAIFDDFQDGDFITGPPWTLRRVFSTANVSVEESVWRFHADATHWGDLSVFTRIAPTPTVDFSFDFNVNTPSGGGCIGFLVAAGELDNGYVIGSCSGYPTGSSGGHLVSLFNGRVDLSGLPGPFLGSNTGIQNTLDGQWHHARVTRTAVGRVSVYVDDVLILEAIDGTKPPVDAVGFFLGSHASTTVDIRIDNVRAGPLESGPSPECSGACVVQVAAGGFHSCARKADGQVRCWGNQIQALAGTFSDVSSGPNHVCAVRSDGTLACWGNNAHGAAMPPAGRFVSVTSGQDYSCAIGMDGSAACWGWNDDGQASPPGGSFEKIVAGVFTTCGLRPDGSPICWGSNRYGQLDVIQDRYVDLALVIGSVFALREDGTVARWGSESHHVENVPPGLFSALSAKNRSACGLRPSVGAICWGNQGSRDGDFLSISTGTVHSCGVRRPGTVLCWGNNEGGQLDVPAGW